MDHPAGKSGAAEDQTGLAHRQMGCRMLVSIEKIQVNHFQDYTQNKVL
jgi:hypothetical protein